MWGAQPRAAGAAREQLRGLRERLEPFVLSVPRKANEDLTVAVWAAGGFLETRLVPDVVTGGVVC